METTILKGHVSPETAYVVDDYPYGYKLRCKIRYWLEYKPKLGFRVVSQTSNPKRGDRWNTPKPSTYSKFGACLYLADNGHVRCAALGEYSNGAEASAWSAKWRDGVPEAGLDVHDRWVAAKTAYDAARKPGDALSVGLDAARKAFVTKGAANGPSLADIQRQHLKDQDHEANRDAARKAAAAKGAANG